MLFTIAVWVAAAVIGVGMLLLGLNIPTILAAAATVEAVFVAIVLIAAIIAGIVVVIRFLFRSEHSFGIGSLFIAPIVIALLCIILIMCGVDLSFMNIGDMLLGFLK